MKKISKWVIAAGIAMIMTSSGMAAVTNVTINFGTDAGRQTYQDAGFTYFEENTNGVTAITNLATAVEFTCTSRYQSGIEQTFAGMGVGLTDPFRISMDLTVDDFPVNSNLRRMYGIRLFGAEGDGNSGIAARLVSDSGAADDVNIGDGASGGLKNVEMTGFTTNEIVAGQSWTFTADGSFVGAGNLLLVLTVDDGVNSQSITNLSLAADLDGDYFGIVGDGEQVVSVSSFSITNITPLTDNTDPSVPSNLVATAIDSAVSLDWANSTDDSTGDANGVAYYNIYRSTTGSYGAPLTNSPVSAYIDADVVNGTLYYYKVSAVDGSDNESALSNEDTATPEADTTAPSVPSNLVATAGIGLINLAWDASTDDISEIAYYNIYRATSSGGQGATPLTNTTSTSYIDADILSDVTYYYKVSAVDSSSNANESALSAEDSAIVETTVIEEWVYTFGSENDGLAGFVQKDIGAGGDWSTLSNSVQMASTNAGTVNTSFLVDLGGVIEPSVGAKYRIQGVVELTDGYADDNNRVGFYLFGDFAEVVNEDEVGALGVIFNSDDNSASATAFDNNAQDNLTLREGIDNTPTFGSVLRNQTVSYSQNLIGTGTVGSGTDIKFTVDLVYTNISGENFILVSGTMTDVGGVTVMTNAAVSFDAYTGDYFGFVTRARARNGITGTPQGRARPWIMNYKSVKVQLLQEGIIPVYTKFQQYLITAGITNKVDFVETNDFDSDGLQNLYEYGIDGDPNDDADTGRTPVLVKADDGSLLYVYPSRTDDPQLTYTVQATTNLLTGPWVAAGTTLLDGTNVLSATFSEFTNTVDIVVEDQRFIRLRIEN